MDLLLRQQETVILSSPERSAHKTPIGESNLGEHDHDGLQGHEGRKLCHFPLQLSGRHTAHGAESGGQKENMHNACVGMDTTITLSASEISCVVKCVSEIHLAIRHMASMPSSTRMGCIRQWQHGIRTNALCATSAPHLTLSVSDKGMSTGRLALRVASRALRRVAFSVSQPYFLNGEKATTVRSASAPQCFRLVSVRRCLCRWKPNIRKKTSEPLPVLFGLSQCRWQCLSQRRRIFGS